LLGQGETALWYLDRLAAALPAEWEVYEERAGVYARLGKPAEQERDEARAVTAGADREYLTRLAGERAAAERWSEAADLCARAAAGEPLAVAAGYRHSLALLKTGDRSGYQRLCARLLREAGAAGPALRPEAANDVAMVCALAPGAVADWDAPLKLVRQALAGLERSTPADETRQQLRHACLNTEGAILYRAGRYREAIERLTEAVAVGGHEGTVEDWILLALAHHGLGERERAGEWWARVRAAKLPSGRFSWVGVEVDLLRREADGYLSPEAADRSRR
jgi:tetratricopeptide (TPR) repeat protein